MNKYCKLTLRCFLALFLISSSFSCTPSVAAKINQDQGSENKIENFTAKDFIGVMTGEEIYVLNSDLSWDAYKEAAYYNVFIDGEKTNDSKITKTKFKTAFDGDVDVDEKMGDSPKDIKIEVKAYSRDDSELASASVIKKIPAKPKFSILEINGKKFQENIEVENPVSIKLKVNNAIKFWSNDNNEKNKALKNLNNYISFEANGNGLASTYSYDEKDDCIIVEPLGALCGSDKFAKGYQLKIKAQFSDKYQLWYTNEDKTFKFKIAKTNSAENPLKIEKILLNDDENKNLMTENSLEKVNVKSTVSIIFNQLIDISSYGVSNTDTKGTGIYITTRETGRGSDESRLTNAQYEKINDNGIWKTKITFTMAGKTYLTLEPDPLKGDTKYYIVIDDTIKSGNNSKISAEIRKSFTTGEGIEKLYKLSVQQGSIKGYTEKDIELTEGTEFTIIADEAPPGKTFSAWYVGEYYKPELTETQKKSNELTLKMRAYDTTFSAEYK